MHDIKPDLKLKKVYSVARQSLNEKLKNIEIYLCDIAVFARMCNLPTDGNIILHIRAVCKDQLHQS